MKSIGKIFSFTFMQHIKGKGYRNATIWITVLCFLLPALIMPAIEYFGKDEQYESKITKVYVIDGEQNLTDYSFLNSADPEQFQNIDYEMADSVERAAEMASADGYAVLLVIEKQDSAAELAVLLPGETERERLGTQLVKTINPQSDMAILQLFDAFGEISGMFTVSGVILALLMLAAGLLLYCSLAAIGGAVAEKPEDLSSTNMLFVMVLLISFFATMYAGGTNSDVPWDAVTWQAWMPFTAILVTPTKILLGGMTIPQALGSLGIVVLTAVLVTLLAGKLYKMMSLYKGNPPGPAKLMEMLKNDRS